MKIRFKDTKHKEFFLSMQDKCREWDVFHKALMYTLGISESCRDHISDLFCFDQSSEYYGIKYETAFAHGWQTSSSAVCVRLAFNLFNGFNDSETDPVNIFDSDNFIYFVEAIKIRHPRSLITESYCVKDKNGTILSENVSSDYKIAESYAKILEKKIGCECIVAPQEEILMEI